MPRISRFVRETLPGVDVHVDVVREASDEELVAAVIAALVEEIEADLSAVLGSDPRAAARAVEAPLVQDAPTEARGAEAPMPETSHVDAVRVGVPPAEPRSAEPRSAEPRPASATSTMDGESGIGSAAASRVTRQEPTDWSALHPLAARLHDLAPDADLAATLAGIELADVDDAAVVEVIAGWERLAAWVAAQQASAVNELRRRREVERTARFVGDEVAARLGTTRHAGEGKVAFAWNLDRVPAVHDALAVGTIDARKAAVLGDELLAVDDAERARIAGEVLERAHQMTVPQIRDRVRRLGQVVDPGAAERRHAKERADRHVHVEPVQHGMAWLHAFLPADEAVAVHTTLTAVADAQGDDDPRPMDARRADALVDLVGRWLDAGTCPDGTPLPTRQRRRPHLQVTASATTLLGLDDAPGELAGYGSIPASMARRIASASTWTPVLVDDAGRFRARGSRTYRPSAAQVDWVADRDVTCTFPGCRVPARRCDLDHLEPFDPDRPAEEQTVTENLQCRCRHHHNLKTHTAWRVRRDDSADRTYWHAPTGHVYERPAEVLIEPPRPGGRPDAPSRTPAEPPGERSERWLPGERPGRSLGDQPGDRAGGPPADSMRSATPPAHGEPPGRLLDTQPGQPPGHPTDPQPDEPPGLPTDPQPDEPPGLPTDPQPDEPPGLPTDPQPDEPPGRLPPF